MDFFFDPVFLEHDTGQHPESPKRLESILEYLEDTAGTKKPENGEKYLPIAHTREYIERVKETCKRGGILDWDTPVSRDSYKAACLAVGAAVDASEHKGFALVRPPGHHAFADHGGGFCIFNNMAIASLRLAERGRRVFILDIDVHHGNGTEELVLNKAGVRFLSIHQSPLYPGTGLENRGSNIINIPLPPGTGDREYIDVLETRVRREMEEFEPDIVGISAGFDTYYDDRGYVSGNEFNLTTATYKKLREILEPYDTFYTLEGGYNPVGIREGIKALTGI